MRTFPTEVALSIYTGRLLCAFDRMHEAIEYLTGGPVFTHQLAHKAFADELAAAVRSQCPIFATVDDTQITKDTYKTWLSDALLKLGPAVELRPMSEVKNSSASYATGEAGDRALEEHCQERKEKDERS